MQTGTVLASDFFSFWESYYGDDFSHSKEQDEHGFRTNGIDVRFPTGKPNNRKPSKIMSLRELWRRRFESRNHAGFYYLGHNTLRQDEINKQLDFIN